MIDESQAKQLIGQTLRTREGDKVGTIGQVYLDDDHGRPEWVTVNTGLFGTNESFVPLAEAGLADGGVTVPYSKDQIKKAPNIGESAHLSRAEEQQLYEHYGIAYTSRESTVTGGTGPSTGTSARHARDYDQDAAVGHDTSGPTTDDAMTRSEERLQVGTETVETGRARLRKWVETENVQVDVPVSKEKARLVTEPITEANRGDALQGPSISEEEHEVVLTEERPVVATETVPVERVRLDKEVEQDVEQVGGDVRKERIELEGDVDADFSDRR
jgi:uncharacterized protein (TIGR02271 family)